ncbi:unnamed protein product [Enterobius vermicularis]|uniref:GDP-fucose protein O-fucosyltransferase 2 n=1 Tax=Enterobius vermicularis TaxID=51028 RepID=A0A0N4USL8_ENTVE|nr:unnamed protein product [Enterobius vermicularis]
MIFLIFWILLQVVFCEQLASVLSNDYSTEERKFLLYDVNYGEGFNLRRDVYMRVANTVRLLRNNGHNYILVLPAWGGLYHWKKRSNKLPWSTFFDINSLNDFVPVIEFQDFLQEINHDGIDEVAYLQAYAEGWTSGNYEIKFDRRPCIQGHQYYRLEDGKWRSWFFSYEYVWAKNFSCISIQGDSNTLTKMIESYYPDAPTLFVDRAEQILHSVFGDKYYWEARRSMRYAPHLVKIGDKFRKEKLGSSDSHDRTVLTGPWRDVKKHHGEALGGDFLCVHWRRQDFVHHHSSIIPSVKGAAEQILKILRAYNLTQLFLSTDAATEEVELLKSHLSSDVSVERYEPEEELTDGEVSVIDQWVCAHARVFTGTHSSTFSYRIQEDREILGFLPKTTFNNLCPDDNDQCEQPSEWKITYENANF